jgi:tripartite-type tricarboxylate transporter receptor subunit TctC
MKRRSVLTMPGLTLAAGASAQSGWTPDRPISLVVPFLAGGAVGSEWVRQRPADGYTLLLGTASSHATNPAALPRQTPYDPVADFTQIASVGGGPLLVVVPAASPYRTIADLIVAIRARPGALSWATSGVGGVGHLTGEYLKLSVGGLQAEHVPYRGGSAVMEALAKGEVAYSLEVLASTAPHLRDGLSRGLAVTSKTRHPLFPDIPTLDETVAPSFEVTTWNILLGPRGLTGPVLASLNAAAGAALSDPAIQARLRSAGVDPARPESPDRTRAFLTAEVAKFRSIVERAGVRLTE